jgi:hypothetical protein
VLLGTIWGSAMAVCHGSGKTKLPDLGGLLPELTVKECGKTVLRLRIVGFLIFGMPYMKIRKKKLSFAVATPNLRHQSQLSSHGHGWSTGVGVWEMCLWPTAFAGSFIDSHLPVHRHCVTWSRSTGGGWTDKNCAK